MSYSTFLMIKVSTAKASAFADFYVQRRILDECLVKDGCLLSAGDQLSLGFRLFSLSPVIPQNRS